jgi:hypothetical protein
MELMRSEITDQALLYGAVFLLVLLSIPVLFWLG